MNTNKIEMSQDALYKYLIEHDVKISRIAEAMGMTPQTAISCFRHNKNRHGSPRYFTVENIAKLNNALSIIANELRNSLVTFGSDKIYTNKHGRTYDPGMIEPLNHLGKILNLIGLTGRILGWNKNKKESIFSVPSSKNYGNISESDVTAINAEVLAVAGVLDGVVVIPDKTAFGGINSSSSI